MIEKNIGVQSIGIKAPMIKYGDDIRKIVINSIKESGVDIDDKDVIGITESVVARSLGNYCTVDDICESIRNLVGDEKVIGLWQPIMSRNRFSLILRAFARVADKLWIYIDENVDEQGNPTHGINKFTGVDIQEYYKQIGEEENCEIFFKDACLFNLFEVKPTFDARCHPEDGVFKYTLKDIMKTPIGKSGYNSEYGVLGSNKAGDEKLKLFPEKSSAIELVNNIKKDIKELYNKDVEVMIYADGCFKSPGVVGESIWEFADPVTSPAYTDGLDGTPNEIKVKYIIDTNGEQAAMDAIAEQNKSNKDLKGNMASQGTTPRQYVDLLASLMDLTSGSGSRCTPFIIVKNYLF